MHGVEWILKKRFWCEGAEGGEKNWKEQYYSYSCPETFRGWPDPDTTWSTFPVDYQDLISDIPNRPTRPNQQGREQLRTLVRERKPDLVEEGDPKWIENPGGGGNWKSNANSIVPRLILVRAVHDAEDEAVSKEVSAYGRIVSLIVEKRLMKRPEVIALKNQMDEVLKLFQGDPQNPKAQAEEIREVEARINYRLSEVVGGVVSIETQPPDVRPVLLPSTTLVMRDGGDGIKTTVNHHGHGLQRTLVMTLLQVLAEIQTEPGGTQGGTRAAILAVEEPELYMHPQMERKMRDALYRLAAQAGIQVICTTHSPVFLDMGQKHKAIVRVVKDETRKVKFCQVTDELFEGTDSQAQRERLKIISRFHPAVNEVFFAKRVVLLEEQTAAVAFERGAEVTGIFERHPHVRRDVTLVDTLGKGNIPIFQEVLNHFQISYTVVHDEDRGNMNPVGEPANARIAALLSAPQGLNIQHMISPTDIEGVLGYQASKDKPYQALRRVDELHAQGALPAQFTEALNWVYFGQATEPAN
jgi:hypothetical protein